MPAAREEGRGALVDPERGRDVVLEVVLGVHAIHTDRDRLGHHVVHVQPTQEAELGGVLELAERDEGSAADADAHITLRSGMGLGSNEQQSERSDQQCALPEHRVASLWGLTPTRVRPREPREPDIGARCAAGPSTALAAAPARYVALQAGVNQAPGNLG